MGNSQDLKAIYEALLKESPALGTFKAKSYKQQKFNPRLCQKPRATGRTVKMEVEYLSETSESLYQNARCHTPHHRSTETTAFVIGREEKWVVPRLLSLSCYSLCGNLSQFSRKVVDTVRTAELIAPFNP
jgi:hypothetical protein